MAATATTASLDRHAERFAERREAIGLLRQMVERSHDENRVGGIGILRQMPGVGHGERRQRCGRSRAARPRLVDKPRRRVDEVHLVAAFGEPERVGAGGAADIDDAGWCGR